MQGYTISYLGNVMRDRRGGDRTQWQKRGGTDERDVTNTTSTATAIYLIAIFHQRCCCYKFLPGG